jgi:hypothetical protein
MARRSRWQNFSDNFNSVYGSFNKLGKDIESKKVMNSDYTDDDGNALAGDALDRRRMMELSKVYTKYGDAEGGLGLRAQQAKIEASKRENDINQQIMQELIRQRGGLTTSQMESDIASTDASTADTKSTTARRDTLLPGEVDQQAATLDNTVASTDNTRSTINRRDALLPGEVENQSLVNAGLGSANRSSAAQADVDEALVDANVNKGIAESSSAVSQSLVDADTAEISDKTLDSTIESSIASNDASTAGSNVKEFQSTIEYDQLDAEEQLLVELNQTEYDNPEDAEAAYRQMVLSDDRIAPERKAEIIRALDDTSLADLQGKATVMAQEGLNALQTGGLDGLVEYYDTVDDGDTMRIERNDDGTVSIVSTRGDVDTVLFTDSSADAEDVVTQQMVNLVSRPGTGFEVVVQAANVENTRQKTDESVSRTSLLDSQKFSELLSQDTERARAELVKAQVDKTRQDIEQSGRGLQGADLIAREGLADLQNSAEFIILGDQRGGAALQAETIGNYMRVMGMAGAPPAGVESQLWFSMTDEEKAAFQ